MDVFSLLVGFFENQKRNINSLIGRVRAIFDETQVGYQLEEQGGVHPKFDEEFERQRTFSIRKLAGAEFTTARGFVSDAETALLSNPMDGKADIRTVFGAVENVSEQTFDARRLHNGSIQRYLKPAVECLYSDGGTAILCRSSLKQVSAMTDWAEGAHFYRHVPGTPEPSQPSEELTLLVVSNGFAYLRWLVE